MPFLVWANLVPFVPASMVKWIWCVLLPPFQSGPSLKAHLLFVTKYTVLAVWYLATTIDCHAQPSPLLIFEFNCYMYAVMTPWNCTDRAWEDKKIIQIGEFNVDFMRFHSSSNHFYILFMSLNSACRFFLLFFFFFFFFLCLL